MQSEPLISVVTPSYNQAPYLEQTIRSVLDQDYPHVEYMVIDGGSTDGSVDIIRRYADRLAYWVSESDRGQADAINKGWARCTGDVVSFLNSDDCLLPGALHTIAATFTANPEAGIVYGQAQWVTADGVPVQRTNVNVDAQGLLDSFVGLPQPAAFVRRTILAKIGLLDASFHFALDGEFFFRALGNFPPVHLTQVLACMRLHDTSKSVSAGTGFAPEVMRIAQKVIANPSAYPRFSVVPNIVMARAHVIAARICYVNGHYREAFAHLRQALGVTHTYRTEIIHRDLPRIIARWLLGRAAYARWSARLAANRLAPRQSRS